MALPDWHISHVKVCAEGIAALAGRFEIEVEADKAPSGTVAFWNVTARSGDFVCRCRHRNFQTACDEAIRGLHGEVAAVVTPRNVNIIGRPCNP